MIRRLAQGTSPAGRLLIAIALLAVLGGQAAVVQHDHHEGDTHSELSAECLLYHGIAHQLVAPDSSPLLPGGAIAQTSRAVTRSAVTPSVFSETARGPPHNA